LGKKYPVGNYGFLRNLRNSERKGAGGGDQRKAPGEMACGENLDYTNKGMMTFKIFCRSLNMGTTGMFGGAEKNRTLV